MTATTYGEYGGRYVPETLIPALDELEQGWLEALADPSFRDELDRLGTCYVGRPSPLYRPSASRRRDAGSSSSART